MVIHIEKRGGKIFSRSKALPVFAGFVKLFYQFGRNHFTCLIMFCILLKHLRLKCPVLHNLRWKLHKVSCQTAYSLIFYISQQRSKPMTEFMEIGLCLIRSKKCRFVSGR